MSRPKFPSGFNAVSVADGRLHATYATIEDYRYGSGRIIPVHCMIAVAIASRLIHIYLRAIWLQSEQNLQQNIDPALSDQHNGNGMFQVCRGIKDAGEFKYYRGRIAVPLFRSLTQRGAAITVRVDKDNHYLFTVIARADVSITY